MTLQAKRAENCIPRDFMEMDIFDYALFLDMGRAMMAKYIRGNYRRLALER